MRKKILIAAAVLAAVAAMVLVSNLLTCSVAPDCANLAEEAAKYWSRGGGSRSEEDLLLRDSVTVGKRKFVLFELNNQLGCIDLTRTFTGRWKIERMGCGDGNFREEIVEEDGDYYLIFGGRNAYFGIHTVRFEISGTIHVVEIPQQDCFLVAQDLMMRTGQDHVLPEKITFHDENGVDITDRVPWNGAMK